MDMNFHRSTLILVTTAPQMFKLILKEQPKDLNKYFKVVVVSGNSEIASYAEELGLDYEIVPMKRRISIFADLLAIYKMIRVLLKHKPDIVHSYSPKAGLISSIAGRICGVRSRIHTFTGLIFPTSVGIMHHILRLVDKLICATCTQVIAEGIGVKRQLDQYGVSSDALVLGHGNIAGVDEFFFSRKGFNVSISDAYEKLDLNPDAVAGRTIFVFIGRINEDKGIEDLFKALPKLDSEKYLCLVIGDFDCTAAYEEYLQGNYIQSNKNIILLGFLDDVRVALSICDCLILPSYREGFPNVVLQAGSMSVASIVTDIPGSNEIISEGENGFLVPPGSPDEISRAMCAFMALSSEQRSLVGGRARQNILEKYTSANYKKILIDFYRSL